MSNVFLQACAAQPAAHTPIWLNRQAGRYMPEYHAVKGRSPSLDFFKDPERAAQATLDAQRILGVDAAIMFADLLPVMEPMGLKLEYVAGEGPVFHNPVRSRQDVDRLRVSPAIEATPYIAKTVENILSALPPDISLIGFAGAPFTLASYAIEGQGSRNYVFVKRMMYQAPELWHALCDKLVSQVTSYVELQIDSGVHAVQLFDSWVGCLSVRDFELYAMPHITKLFDNLRGKVPLIYFGTGNGHLLDSVARARPDVMALDWRVPLGDTWRRLSVGSVQGNLDPIVLCADRATIESQAKFILDDVQGRPGHIFNLGHGIIPETPVDNVKALVDFVHEYSARQPQGRTSG
jgi:uroporphyrinogen decarboxylase